MSVIVSNAQARRHLLWLSGLAGNAGDHLPASDRLSQTVTRLGYVQLDSINTVARAHDHILRTRIGSYRPSHLAGTVEKQRTVFENWTHDAAVIPVRFFAYWRHRFAREKERLAARWTRKFDARDFEADLDRILEHVTLHGPAMARDFEREKGPGTGWWDWHPSKAALEYLWRTGRLAIARRQGFQKVYDLTERVIPARHLAEEVDHDAFVDWACRAALARLGWASRGEIAAFFDLLGPAEVESWIAANREELVAVQVEGATGGKARAAWSLPAALDEIADLPEPGDRVRILSPFDPFLRDRARTERLFGFHYRIEIFVPEARRRYGYYVFPVLRGDRLVGRIDMKCDRDRGQLVVRAFWPERGVRRSRALEDRLEAELQRMRRFAGMEAVSYLPDWRREPT